MEEQISLDADVPPHLHQRRHVAYDRVGKALPCSWRGDPDQGLIQCGVFFGGGRKGGNKCTTLVPKPKSTRWVDTCSQLNLASVAEVCGVGRQGIPSILGATDRHAGKMWDPIPTVLCSYCISSWQIDLGFHLGLEPISACQVELGSNSESPLLLHLVGFIQAVLGFWRQ